MPASDLDTAPVVLSCTGLRKVYRMGEVDVRALGGVDLDLYAASSSCCSARRAAASRRCSTSSGGLDVPTRGPRAAIADHDLTRRRRGRADAVPPRSRRLRVPVLQPDPEPDRARERRARHRDRRRSDGPGGRARARRPRRAARSLSRRSSRAASSSASRSRARSPSGPTCCCATSRPARSTSQTGVLVLEVIERVNRELGTTTAHHHAQRADRRRWPTAWSRSPTAASQSDAQRGAHARAERAALVTGMSLRARPQAACATCGASRARS